MGKHWTLISRILAGKPIITWNQGLNKGNVTHEDDFAKGVIGLIGNSNAFNEAFNVCGEELPTYK
jgi:nucleoside-diphosphate-sugar epimerase